VDIGGQDSKAIRLRPDGRVAEFVMNDRCAAGTGRFLEMLAMRLSLDWSALNDLSRQARQPAIISNTCVVFAETEIVGLLAEGASPADIIAGVHHSIATRVASMAGRPLEPTVVFTGGVARQPGMVRALETVVGCSVLVAPEPQFTGALGAAILAGRKPGAT
jgi:predicted CoA-substrate-specific enzyme activase